VLVLEIKSVLTASLVMSQNIPRDPEGVQHRLCGSGESPGAGEAGNFARASLNLHLVQAKLHARIEFGN